MVCVFHFSWEGPISLCLLLAYISPWRWRQKCEGIYVLVVVFMFNFFVLNLTVLSNVMFPCNIMIYLNFLPTHHFWSVLQRDFLTINTLGFMKKSPFAFVQIHTQSRVGNAVHVVASPPERDTWYRVEWAFHQTSRIEVSVSYNCWKKTLPTKYKIGTNSFSTIVCFHATSVHACLRVRWRLVYMT